MLGVVTYGKARLTSFDVCQRRVLQHYLESMSMSRPFCKEFVIEKTFLHIMRAVTISLDKVVSRIREFEGDSDKSKEILQTLALLQSLQEQLTRLETHFKGTKNGES